MAVALKNIKNIFTRPVALAEDRTGRPSLDEVGRTGTSIFGSIVQQDEYNSDLKGDKGLKIYDRMRMSDGQVRSVLQFVTLPIRALGVRFEPVSDLPKDVEVAEFVESCYADKMSITWDDYLRHVLLMLPLGFSLFEKVWKVEDGRYMWRKLAPRLPKSIKKFIVDDEGGLSEIEQRASNVTVRIPVDNLLLFVNEREGSNFYGTSILRSAYKHWWMKEGYYKADAVAHERWGGGAVDISIPDDATAKEITEAKNVAEAFRTNSKNYLIHREGFTFNVLGMKGTTLPNSEANIREHNQQIMNCILGQFLELGRTATGSRATAVEQKDIAYLSLQSIVRNIEDTNNRYAIPQLVDYNFSGIKEYPKMVFDTMDSVDVDLFSNAISRLIQAGGITKDVNLEQWIRSNVDAPELTDEQIAEKKEAKEQMAELRAMPAKKEEEPEEKEIAACDHDHDVKLYKFADGFVSWREPTQEEQLCLNLVETQQRLDKGEQDVVDAVADIKKAQKQSLVKEVAKVMNTVDEAAFEKRLDALGVIKKKEMSTAIVKELKGVFNYGKSQVKADRKRQGIKLADDPRFEPTEGDAETLRFLRKKAEHKVNDYSMAILAGLTFAMLDQRRTGQVDMTPLAALIDEIGERKVSSLSRNLVADSWNMGRSTEASLAGDDIEEVVYTGILDGIICENCRRANGSRFKYGSTRHHDLTPPLRSREFGVCLGGKFGEGCRCTLMYLYKERGV